ncbi:hypothetical protein XELAEV_18032739mg [Xenopus laevis]|uniref:Uncharacterized protein n=1 Tax=Xenopus laevis TaxID=8355 RepID=A0A974HDC8_XENLA|nr:hypothetical protein XELAEV_18032739mg [Xenopus laevis]
MHYISITLKYIPFLVLLFLLVIKITECKCNWVYRLQHTWQPSHNTCWFPWRMILTEPFIQFLLLISSYGV